jgi:ABC-type phosphate transport system substrate-binding protein
MSLLLRPSLLVLVLATLVGGARAEPRLVVVIHPDRPDALTLEDVRQIYLKKRRYWSDGHPIIPINRDAASEARATFSRAVFGPVAGRLATYWKRLYFQGVLPPATLASAAAVKRFVATEPNAIGYLEVHEADDSVRVAVALD